MGGSSGRRMRHYARVPVPLPMALQLQLLRADHGPGVLEFELANRAYFAASISDRGDDYFEHFGDRHSQMLAEQEAGYGAYFVLVEAEGPVVGRFNLFGVSGGTAEIGYRVAQRVAGRGVATTALRELCRLAASERGLHSLTARVAHDNIASQRVLAKAGFVVARATDIGGLPALGFRLDLASQVPRDGDDPWPSDRAHLAADHGAADHGATQIDGALYQWRRPVTDEEVAGLHHAAFGDGTGSEAGWWGRQRHLSLGWVTAVGVPGRASPVTGAVPPLIGFANVAWDGYRHAFLLDVAVAPGSRRRGIATRMVQRAAQEARAAGCEWLHVDFEDHLAPFYLGSCAMTPTKAGLLRLQAH